jgi:hypothetical protein
MPSDALPARSGAGASAGLGAVIALSALLGAHYVWRTSVMLGDTRFFLLWDDAMISMQYAKNLAEGHGLVWSVGAEPVQGFTNLGVTLLMTALHWLPLAPAHFSLVVQLANLAALAAIVAISYRLMRWGFGDSPAPALTAAAGVACCFPLQIYSLQGSDTGFICLWLLASQLVLVRSLARGRGWPPGLFALLAVGLAMRLDSAVLLLPFAGVFLSLPGPRLRSAVVGAALLGGVVGALLLFGQLYYGDPLPNTYYLKATGQPRALMLAHGARQLAHWAPYWLPIAVLAAFCAVRQWSRPCVRLAVGSLLSAVAYHVWVGGDLQPRYGSRFLIPVLPLLLCLGAAGARELFEECLAWGPPGVRRSAGVAVALLAMLLSNSAATVGEVVSRGGETMLQRYNRQNLASALFYRDHTRPRTSIGLHWAGVIAYFSERPVVDVLGKSERHIARLQVERFAPGHSKWDWEYVVNVLQPDIMNAESRGLLQRPDFRRLYVRADPPQAPYFYIRADRLQRIRDGATRITRLPPLEAPE